MAMNNFEQMALMGGAGTGLGALQNIGGGATGHRGGFRQVSPYSPVAQGSMDQLVNMGMQNADFGPIQEYYKRMFRTESVPSLAERFTAMGGGQRSSSFQGAMGSAEAGLMAQLAALRSQHGMQQLQMGLRPQFENFYQPARPGMLQGGLQGLLSMLPALGMMGGPVGMAGGLFGQKLLQGLF
jgi:hypothetical protein